MKVRVKKGHKGFIYGSLRDEGEVFDLKPVTHLDSKGKPVVILAKDQFNSVWMEKIKACCYAGEKPV